MQDKSPGITRQARFPVAVTPEALQSLKPPLLHVSLSLFFLCILDYL
jgi:hypothetical protein